MKQLSWAVAAILPLAACGGAADTGGDTAGEVPGGDGEVGSVSHAIVSATASYLGNQNNQSSCATTRQILLREPDGPGPFPVFLYTAGAGEPHNSSSATAIITEAARQGFVAASVQYDNAAVAGSCGAGADFSKSRCIYSTSANPQSAVGVVCARSKSGCSTEGIVTAGFSLGATLAVFGRNLDMRVRGTWAMGFADVDVFNNHQICFDEGAATFGTNTRRLLSNSRLRLVNGINQVNGFGQPVPTLAYNRTTGRTCVNNATSCFVGPNQSGWYETLQTEVNFAANPVGHCFIRNNPLIFGFIKQDCETPPPGHTVDPVFARIPPAATFPSGMFQNIAWLKNTILPLGNQI